MIFLLRRLLRHGKTSFAGRISIALGGALFLNIIFGFAFYFAERAHQPGLTLEDAIWWAMVTMTTVGYGDFFPQTFFGRFIVAYPCFILGIGLIGYLLGSLAEALIDFSARKRKGLSTCSMKNHLIICHFPSEAKVVKIIDELRCTPRFANTPIALIDDTLEEIPDSLRKREVVFIKGDATDDLILEKANLKHAQGAFILARDPTSISSDACTFAIGSIIEQIEKTCGHAIETVAEIVSERSLRMIRHSAIDRAVTSEGVGDRLLVQEFLNPGLAELFTELLSNSTGSQLYIRTTKLTGRSLKEIQIAALQHPIPLQIIGVNHDGKALLTSLQDVVVKDGDSLFILAEKGSHFAEFEDSLLSLTS